MKNKESDPAVQVVYSRKKIEELIKADAANHGYEVKSFSFEVRVRQEGIPSKPYEVHEFDGAVVEVDS